MNWKTAFVVAFSFAYISSVGLAQEKMEYPKSKRVDQVDEYFGTPVQDPFRWLEENVRNSSDVKEWVDAQNKLTFSLIEKLPYRAEIEQRLTQLWDYEKYGTPFKRGSRYFYFKNSGLQNQSVLYKLDSLDGNPEVLINPNKWTEDGTDAIGGMAFSDDGNLMAYGVQKAGSDWRTWNVMEVESGKKLTDELNWLKFGGVTWTKDSKGFFYSRYDEPSSDEKFQGLNLGQKVYYHKLGDPQSADQLVHQNPENPTWGFSPSVSEDGNFLVVTVWKGTDDRYRVLYKSLDDPNSKLTTLIDDFENEYSFIGNEGSKFYFKSDFNAPKKCILIIDVKKPSQDNWKVIIPEANEAMESASMVGNYVVADYLKDAKTQVKIYDLGGDLSAKSNFPALEQPAVLAVDVTTTKRSIAFQVSTVHRAPFAMTC